MLGREDFGEEGLFGECQIEGLVYRSFSAGQEGELKGHARQ